jgi:hypothetical protein
MLIDLNGVSVEPSLIAVVRESSLDDTQTIIFTAGQSAMDGGHLIDMPIDEVLECLKTVAMRELALELADQLERENKEQDENKNQYPPTVPEQEEFERG